MTFLCPHPHPLRPVLLHRLFFTPCPTIYDCPPPPSPPSPVILPTPLVPPDECRKSHCLVLLLAHHSEVLLPIVSTCTPLTIPSTRLIATTFTHHAGTPFKSTAAHAASATTPLWTLHPSPSESSASNVASAMTKAMTSHCMSPSTVRMEP